jgi:hypothetical protein
LAGNPVQDDLGVLHESWHITIDGLIGIDVRLGGNNGLPEAFQHQIHRHTLRGDEPDVVGYPSHKWQVGGSNPSLGTHAEVAQFGRAVNIGCSTLFVTQQ